MTALLTVEFEPDTNTAIALHALRHTGLLITSLDVSTTDLVASVEAVDDDALHAAVQAIRNCPCVRSSVVFPSQA